MRKSAKLSATAPNRPPRLCEIEASRVRRFCGKIGPRQADTDRERIGGRCAAFTGAIALKAREALHLDGS
jgi:hypothetical protein